MTDSADFGSLLGAARERPASVPLPRPVPFGTPVVISDCITPLASETLLCLIWKRLDRAKDAD